MQTIVIKEMTEGWFDGRECDPLLIYVVNEGILMLQVSTFANFDTEYFK